MDTIFPFFFLSLADFGWLSFFFMFRNCTHLYLVAHTQFVVVRSVLIVNVGHWFRL